MRGLSPVAASRGHSSSQCAGLSLSRPLLLRSTGSRRAGSVVVAHRPSCSAACGIFPDQGSNLCALHWQVDSQPLRHQGSPPATYFYSYVLALQLTASSPGGEGTVCGKGQALSLGNVLVLREENGKMAAAAFSPSFLPRGGAGERAGT